MLTRLSRAVAVAGTASLLAVVSMAGASAHEQALQDDGVIDSGKDTHAHDAAQHGGNGGHLAPVGPTKGLTLLSKTRLSQVVEGKIADVGVLKTTAYLAAWGGQTCDRTGVYVVDVANVSAPKEIAFIPAKAGSYPGEGIQALSVSTPAFTGDVLVTNTETCDAGTNVGGVSLYDVTNPAAPRVLFENYGDDSGTANKNAHETHSAFLWDAGDKAYAALVDNEEAADVDILDISDPRKPVFVAEYDLALLAPQILQPGRDLDEVFLHDMVVKQMPDGRFVMLASYWDAGYVQLDVTNPAAAKVVSDSDFAAVDPEAAESGLRVAPEGNAHQAEFTADNRYVLAADEDFAPYALTGQTADGQPFTSSQGSDTTQLAEGQTLSGATVFRGRACNGDAVVPRGDGTQIAVVERGLCTFTEKVANVEKAGGYVAAVVFNREGSDGCNAALSMSVAGGIPTFGVAPRAQGFALFGAAYDDAACLAGDGTRLAPISLGAVGTALTFTSYFDGWGYMHLLKNDGSMTELDTYALPQAHDPAFASGFGDLSVHEVATSRKDASVAYVAYYSGGLRVIDVEDVRTKGGTVVPQIVEKAAHIDKGGSNLWGVETFSLGGKEYVAASDRDLGLYLYEYTPVNAP